MKRYLRCFMVWAVICALIVGCSAPNLSQDSQQSYKSENTDVGEAGAYEGVAGDDAYNEYEEAGDVSDYDGEKLALQTADGSGDAGSTEGGTEASQTGDEGTGTSEAGTETKKETKEEKLVYTCNLSIETTTYKETIAEIEKQISKYAGIIESRNEYDNDYGWYRSDYQKTSGTMNATIVVKIPSKNYQDFLKSLDGTGKMTNKSMNVTNITRTYYDTQATIESMKIQEKRLLKMMDEARTIEDMITVEKRLTEVQTQLNQYKNQLSTMDTEVAYSTVTMDIQEVMEYKADVPGRKTNTFAERLKNTFEDTWTGFLSFLEDLLFLLIHLAPYIVLLLILWFVSRPLRRKWKEHRQAKRMARGQSGKGKKEKAKGKGGRFLGRKKDQADIMEEAESKAGRAENIEEADSKADQAEIIEGSDSKADQSEIIE